MNETLEVENTKKISKSIVQEKTIINDNYFYLFVKRFFDFIGSIVGIAFLIPIVIVIKIFFRSEQKWKKVICFLF